MITSWTRYGAIGTMRRLLTCVVILLCFTSTSAAIAENGLEEYSLKRTILLEERTAIWCEVCAEVDPELETVARSHGSRTAIVALHTGDSFENEASIERIRYQSQIDNNTYGTPTFFVDGYMTAQGYDAWSDVQSQILSRENSRGQPEELALTMTSDGFEAQAPDFGQITIMVIEHDKPVPEGVDNPGEDTRDRVLIGMRVIDTSGNQTDYGNISLPATWSIVMVHEPVEGGHPYGVVEISNRNFDLEDSKLLTEILLVCILLGGLLVFIPKKNYLYAEEE